MRPEDWGVNTLENAGSDFQEEPCSRCPWRRDAPVGFFPPSAFQHSARTAYDLVDSMFACHMAGSKKPKTCASFLLRGASDNLAVRVSLSRGKADYSSVHTDVELYDSYREMAIANGVDPDDPVLAPCRGDTPVKYLPRTSNGETL